MRKVAAFLVIVALLIGGGIYLNNRMENRIVDFITGKEQVIEIVEPEVMVLGSKFERHKISHDTFDELTKNDKILVKGEWLRNLEIDYLYDEERSRIALLNEEHWIYIEAKNFLVDDVEYNAVVKMTRVNGELFFEVNQLIDILGLKIRVNEANKRILIEQKGFDNTEMAVMKDETPLYVTDVMDTGVLEYLGSKVPVQVVERTDSTVTVISEALNVGYLSPFDLINEKVIKGIEIPWEAPFKSDERLFLVWDQKQIIDDNETEKVVGVNILSPSWYELVDGEGHYISTYKDDYYVKFKELGYEIWPLVNNGFDPDMTSVMLNDSYARQTFIKDLLAEFKDRGFTGINIDFENIYLKDKDAFVQFYGELAHAFRKEGIIVSLDVTVMGGSDNWSRVYDRKRLGRYTDYMFVMTYDQHWASSPVSGTVSGYQWMRDKMLEILEIVPKEKLVLGLPLYMRVWNETPSTELVNTMSVSSDVLTIRNLKNYVTNRELTPLWDEVNKQFYFAFIEDGVLKKIWVENIQSIQFKAELVRTFDLAGVGCWRKGFEIPDIWTVINDEIN